MEFLLRRPRGAEKSAERNGAVRCLSSWRARASECRSSVGRVDQWMRQIRQAYHESRSAGSRAFAELLSEHVDALFGTALRLCGGNLADAEDLLQDATLRAFDGFASLR